MVYLLEAHTGAQTQGSYRQRTITSELAQKVNNRECFRDTVLCGQAGVSVVMLKRLSNAKQALWPY